MTDPNWPWATVLARHGRQLLVHCDDEPADRLRQAVTRGRRDDCCVGDRVAVSRPAPEQAVVESVAQRRNCVLRSDGGRTKLLAANVDQAGVVIAGDPPFSEALLMRALAALHHQGIAPLIIATKTDLEHSQARIAARLALYRALGYPVVEISVPAQPAQALERLQPWLLGRDTLLLGQSGMGKSTLINLLVPEAEQATREISSALSTGRHTTSFCRMFDVKIEDEPMPSPRRSRIIDSPGFQLFGIAHLSRSELMHGLPDFAALLGRCRFANCLHLDEPACAVQGAVQSGAIDRMRHHFYRELLPETLQAAR
jgi:ribosome biogenesis GTPase